MALAYQGFGYLASICGLSMTAARYDRSALDIKSFAMAVLKSNYRESTKRNMPKRWFEDLPHTHVALSDAIEQGALFCNMLAESRS